MMSVWVLYAGSVIEAERLAHQRDPLHVGDDYNNRETMLGSQATVWPGCSAMDRPTRALIPD